MSQLNRKIWFDGEVTVNQMLNTLRRIQRDGHGELPMFQLCTDTNGAETWCPLTKELHIYSGHVVAVPERFSLNPFDRDTKA